MPLLTPICISNIYKIDHYDTYGAYSMKFIALIGLFQSCENPYFGEVCSCFMQIFIRFARANLQISTGTESKINVSLYEISHSIKAFQTFSIKGEREILRLL